MSLIDNTNNLTTKLAALWRKVKTKATAQGASINNTDSITQIVDKMPSEVLSKVHLTDTYTLNSTALDDFIQNWCVFEKMPSNMSNYFKNLPITKLPNIDFSKVTSLNSAFYGCDKIKEITINTTKLLTSLNQAFAFCTSLTSQPKLDYSQVTDFYDTFWNNTYTEIDLSDSYRGITFAYTFENCTNLERLKINLRSAIAIGMLNIWQKKLYYQEIKELGTAKKSENLDASITIWGQGSDEARQSLVDSLLTYSFDRAAAGYAALTIKLPAASLALLTDAEKAAITAKGFNLAS